MNKEYMIDINYMSKLNRDELKDYIFNKLDKIEKFVEDPDTIERVALVPGYVEEQIRYSKQDPERFPIDEDWFSYQREEHLNWVDDDIKDIITCIRTMEQVLTFIDTPGVLSAINRIADAALKCLEEASALVDESKSEINRLLDEYYAEWKKSSAEAEVETVAEAEVETVAEAEVETVAEAEVETVAEAVRLRNVDAYIVKDNTFTRVRVYRVLKNGRALINEGGNVHEVDVGILCDIETGDVLLEHQASYIDEMLVDNPDISRAEAFEIVRIYEVEVDPDFDWYDDDLEIMQSKSGGWFGIAYE